MSIRKAKNELTLATHILEKSLERKGETVEEVQDTIRFVRKLLSNASSELKKRTPCYKIETPGKMVDKEDRTSDSIL